MATEEISRASQVPCATIEVLLSSYVDNEVSGDERAQVEMHVHTCRGCRSQLAFLTAMTKGVKPLPLSPMPTGLSERIAAATFLRPSFWDRLTATLRPAPARYALGSALLAGTLCAVFLPRLSQTNPTVVLPAPVPVIEPTPSQAPAEEIVRADSNPTPAPPRAKRNDVTVASGAARLPVRVAKNTPSKPVALIAAKEKASRPTDHRLVVVAPTTLLAGESPKQATGVAAAVAANTTVVVETPAAPPSVTVAAIAARPHSNGGHMTISTDDSALAEATPGDERVKVALSVTQKQVRDASGTITSLSGASGEYQSAGRNLTIVASPVR